jgi:hypothetical protein
MAATATSADAWIYWNGVRVGKFTSATQSTERTPLETTALGDTDATFQPGGLRRNTFSGSLLYDPGDSAAQNMLNAIDDMSVGLLNNGRLRIQWLRRQNTTQADREGAAVISSRSNATSVGDLQTISIDIQFTGEVTGSF